MSRLGMFALFILIMTLAALYFAMYSHEGGNVVYNYDEQAPPSVKMSFFGNKYEAENVEVLEEIITDFMRKRPDVRVSYESLKGAAYYEALKKRAAAGNYDDVFIVDHDTALTFAGKGLLAELTELAAVQSFSDSMLNQMRDGDGKIYWAPTSVSAFGLYCNTDLLKAHGQNVPRNLPEWEAVCGYFVEKGITPIVANNDISLKTLAIAKGFYPIYRGGGEAEIFARLNAGEEKFSLYLRPGFELARRFCDRGYIDAGRALKTMKTSDDLKEFAEGKSPFMLTGAWAARRVKAAAPELSFTIVPYPVLEDGAVLVINPDSRMAVGARGSNPEAAKAFVSFFLRSDNLQKYDDSQSSFSPMKDGAIPSVKEIAPLVESYRAQRAVIGSDSLIERPIWGVTAEVSERLLAGEDTDSLMDWMDSALSREDR